jgi:hypothetical protein
MEFKRPLLTGGLFFLLARAYTMSIGVEVPSSSQLVVAGVLAASAVVSEQVPANPAVKALTTGSVFAGSMYLLLGNDAVLTHTVLGTLSAYAAEVIVPDDGQEEEKREEVVNEFE